jgi:cysteine desulfurase
MNKRVYLDFAAATPIESKVKKAMADVSDLFANPSALYSSGLESRQRLEEARKKCALFLQCSSDEIVFTSGSTEANNLAILGTAKNYKSGRIISIASEHSSVIGPLDYLKKNGFEIKFAKISKTGQVDLNNLASLLTKDTRLVSISYANSEIGTIQPIRKIGQLIKAFNSSRNANINFHSDASAASLVLNCEASRLGVDMLSIGGAKIYGPHSAGILYVRRNCRLSPIEYGGGQESSLRPGTPDLKSAVGIAAALESVLEKRKSDLKKFQKLHDLLLNCLKGKTSYIYNGHPSDRIFNIISLVLPGHSGEDMVAKLDVAGFEVSTGAACEASNDKPSRALMAIGLSVNEAQSSLRISLGRKTAPAQLVSFASKLIDIIEK